jgi:hypothetical protein
MMQIKNLEIIETLAIGSRLADRIRGGISFSILDGVIDFEGADVVTLESLYRSSDSGFASVSVLGVTKMMPGYMISFASSNSTISIG